MKLRAAERHISTAAEWDIGIAASDCRHNTQECTHPTWIVQLLCDAGGAGKWGGGGGATNAVGRHGARYSGEALPSK